MEALCYTVMFLQTSKSLRCQVSCFLMVLSLKKVMGFVTFLGANTKNAKEGSISLLGFVMTCQNHVFEALRKGIQK